MTVPGQALSVPVSGIIVVAVVMRMAIGVVMGTASAGGRGCNKRITHREGKEPTLGP